MKQRKVSWVENDSHVNFGQKLLCEAVLCRDATASPFIAKVRDEVFAHFHAVAVKRHSNMRN
jgi:hypothetical protein